MASSSSQDSGHDYPSTGPWSIGVTWKQGAVPLVVLLLVLTAAVYWPSLDHEFQYDDKWKLVNNPNFENPLALFETVDHRLPGGEDTRLLPNFTFSLNRMLWGWQPFPFHLTNLLLHLLNIVLVAMFARFVLSRLGYKEPNRVALLAAALFALHPLNCEAVVYCNARPNLMVVTFYLLTMVSFVRAMEASELSILVRIRRWAAFTAALLGALLSKELAVTVVVMAPLLFFWLNEDSHDQHRVIRRMWISIVSLVVIGIATVLLTDASTVVFNSVFLQGTQLTGSWVLTLMLTVLGQARVLVSYFWLALVPLPRFLNVDHGVAHLHERLLGSYGAAPGTDLLVLSGPLVCSALVVFLVVAAFSLRRQNRFVSFFLLWSILCHAPTTIVPRAEALVEYRTYLPMVGVCMILAWILIWTHNVLGQRFQLARAPVLWWALTGTLVVAMAAGTTIRCRSWATQITLWQDAVAKQPDNPRAHNNLGGAYVLRDRLDPAISHYRRALELKPHYAEAHSNLGNALTLQGEIDAAIWHLRRAVAYDPDLAGAHTNLGNALSTRGLLNEALEHYYRALEINAFQPDVQSNLGMILLHQGKLGESRKHFFIALKLNPDSAEAHNNLGYVLARANKIGRAKHHFEQALEINNSYAEAHNNLGYVLFLQGNLDNAIRHYQQALKIRPGYAEAHYNLANAFRNQGKLELAVIHYQRALEINPSSARIQHELRQTSELRDN
jgi:tetratricopeptide (TPR) repeat protein